MEDTMHDHPSSADWMLYLYGESTETDRRSMSEHLAACPECAGRVERWRATMSDLDAWETETRLEPAGSVVQSSAHRSGARNAFMRVAIGLAGLALTFLAGFGARSLIGPGPDDLKSQLRAELQTELRAEFSRQTAESTALTPPNRVVDDAGLVSRLASWESASAGREERVRSMLSGVLQNQITLREDLETLAVEAEAQIMRTRRELRRLRDQNQITDEFREFASNPY